jgi:HEAT repeat protein
MDDMKNVINRSVTIWMVLLAVLVLTFPAQAKPETEDELIADLSSRNEDKVVETLLALEKQYPTSTKAFPTMKKLLTDSRQKVRRKAARVLGVLHAEVDDQNLNDICAMLKASDAREQMDALISLRGLKAQSKIPEITPLLNSPTPNVVRDACRTLAELGNKELIPSIEPLLKHADKRVQTDAQDAIYKLKAKA